MPSSHSQNLTICQVVMRFERRSFAQAQELLVSATGPVRAKSGCLACRVGSDPTESGSLVYYEEWESDAAFRRHVKSEDFWRVLVAMDLCSEEPTVTLGTLSATQGLEYLKQLRGATWERHSEPDSKNESEGTAQ